VTKYNNVFSPFKIGNVEVKNRIETPPMLSCMATADGFMTREMMEFYGAFARGGSGIVTIGDSAVDYEYGKGHHGQLNLGDDRTIAGLSNFVEFIQKFGAKASIEINHPGRMASVKVLNGKYPIAPSCVTTTSDIVARRKVMTTEMDQAIINRVVENYADAAYRCLMAGFEIVMIHGAHGNLLAQFVSPLTNKRSDKYGGDLKNRAQFVVEVLQAIRNRVGNQLAIEYRVSGSELDPEGMQEKDTIEFIKIIEDKIDLVHVSLGLVNDPRYLPAMAQPTYFSHNYNVERAAAIKKAVRIPVTCVGSIIDLATADRIISEGKADIVAMGRPQIADPEIVNKSRRGELDDIRPCIRCQVCGEKPSNFYPVRCTVNPIVGREIEYRYLPPAAKKKKVVIIGGGPAGMQAAITASSRGHQVFLFEKEKELGGALRYAAGPSFKSDMKRYLDWLIRKTRQSTSDIRLSCKATVKNIKEEQPDVLILSVGGEPVMPDIPGIKEKQVVWAGNVDLDQVKTGERVVVAGAGMTGCETALHLAQQGKKVTIIDMLGEPEIAKDASYSGKLALLELLNQHGVVIKTETQLVEITDLAAIVVDNRKKRYELPADTVVLALGLKPLSKVVRTFHGLIDDEYIIGDCSTPGNLIHAIHDGFNVAMEI
jgi:2,4-dienoyl-CoA reductase-like NADH-dependent reductase (Old Yellow Enzyme family)/thioredoxin reductase